MRLVCQSAVNVRIEGVDSAVDYAAVLVILQSLAPVLDTYVTSVEGSDLVLELSTEGQQSQLIEIIELDRK